MPNVTVTALKTFDFEGRAYRRGEVFSVSPINAAILRYQHKVVLGGKLPPVVPEPEPPKRRRTYRRRDMLAESSSPPDEP